MGNMSNFVVTTRLEVVNSVNTPIIMIDGTVPGWKPRPIDLHFDHHRDGGADIQIDELPPEESFGFQYTFVTTQLDADACVAAAYLLLPVKQRSREVVEKMRAIAYDCDHLGVPPELSHLKQFAADAVAGLKVSSRQIIAKLGLDPISANWSVADKARFGAVAFRQGVEWIVDAAQGLFHWPGERGQDRIREYWEKVKADTQMILEEKRLEFYRGIPIVDLLGIPRYVDPRAGLDAITILSEEKGIDLHPVTLTRRELYRDGKSCKITYTLGCNIASPETKNLDYIKSGIFFVLTAAESEIDPTCDGWGGRKTVGGSGWNSSSNLSPTEVLDIVINCLKEKR